MNPNFYKKQRERALKRKIELIENKGGKCEVCGYDKNITALEFHHIDPSTKSFNLDSRHLSNNNIEVLKNEVEKCILVCANCHREIHNPSFEKDNIENLLNELKTKNIKIYSKKRKTKVCPVCGKEFEYVKGKIFCSKECREKSKNYPSYEEIIKIYYDFNKNLSKTAKYFNLTRKIVSKIIKDNMNKCE